MTSANRGKSAEADVRKYLKAYDEKHQDFDWHRVPDAHSAGGRFNPVVYDFAFFRPGVHGGLEVKEVKHACRIPHGNFGEQQVAKLWKRQLAGGVIVVIVYHSTSQMWRVTDLTRFRVRTGGSWDLSDLYEFHSCKDALDSLRLFV